MAGAASSARSAGQGVARRWYSMPAPSPAGADLCIPDIQKNISPLPTQSKDLVFTRGDLLMEQDNHDVVIFFARPEVMCGLFTLANFEQDDPNGVICPWGPGAVPSCTTRGSNGRRKIPGLCCACSTPLLVSVFRFIPDDGFSDEKICPGYRVYDRKFPDSQKPERSKKR